MDGWKMKVYIYVLAYTVNNGCLEGKNMYSST